MYKSHLVHKGILVALVACALVACKEKKATTKAENRLGVETVAVTKQSKIVYVSHAEDDLEIFVMDANGKNPVQLTHNSAEDMYPIWSPDASKIAFLSDRNGALGIYIMNADGSNLELLKPNSFAIPSWSKDGQQILITVDTEKGSFLKTININDKSEFLIDTGSDSNGFGTWSPNGDYIVFESSRDGNSEIYRANIDGSDVKRLTQKPSLDEWPSWSKDGKQIAFAVGIEGDKDIWIMNADGSNKQKVTKNTSIGDAFPSWSPDGKHIVFTTFTDNVKPEIMLVDIAQKSIQKITDGSGPNWSLFKLNNYE